ncbi:MAG: homocysteine S-methyltransferase family protein [Defluviitaleaceae bacterium]|nr:homocysteine S-methyltransferase family protein [Defluviitaleaceae bacterium]
MDICILDGGTGTEFHKQNLTADPVTLNLSHPQAVTDLHRAYLDAGANILTANTFGAYSHKHQNFADIIAAAFNNAKTAKADKADQAVKIALDMGPTGLMLEPYGDVTAQEAAAIFAQTIAEGVKNGADLILIETMMDPSELEIAVTEAKKTGLPVYATMSFNPTGRTMYGADIPAMVSLLDGLGVDALGMNCGEGLDAYGPLVEELLQTTKLPVIFQPNAGLPQVVDGVPQYNVAPAQYAAFMTGLAAKGVSFLGGCCGTTPAHIAAMVKGCRGL